MARVLEITPKQYLELAELGVPVFTTGNDFGIVLDRLSKGGDGASYDLEELEIFATWGPQRHLGCDWKYFTLVDSD